MRRMLNPIESAIELVGSQAELARRTGVSQTAIIKARRKGRASVELAEAIERATDGVIPKEKLVWPAPAKAA